jgi:hypothetical protein
MKEDVECRSKASAAQAEPVHSIRVRKWGRERDEGCIEASD